MYNRIYDLYIYIYHFIMYEIYVQRYQFSVYTIMYRFFLTNVD